MKTQIGASAMALALILTGCGGGEANSSAAGGETAQLQQIPAPNNGDWREVVSRTPQGGFVMGNPDAPVKLVEYASLTCPHCARFSADATAALRDNYIRSGQVSWEYRSFVLGGAPDMVLSLLARCQQPSAFFRTVEQIFEQQQELISRIDDQEIGQIQSLPPERQLAPYARAMDLDTFFARRGMPESRFSQCLANTQEVQQLTDMTNRAATEEGVNGTPNFFINAVRQDVTTWDELEPRLRSAIGG